MPGTLCASTFLIPHDAAQRVGVPLQCVCSWSGLFFGSAEVAELEAVARGADGQARRDSAAEATAAVREARTC